MDMFKKAHGFSLLEVLIALVILAIALLSLAGLMTTSTAYNASGSRVTEASVLAQDRLELLRGTAFKDIDPSPAGGVDSPGANGMVYNVSWSVNAVPNPVPPPDDSILKAVTITVKWTDKISHSLTFGPYTIARPPGQ